MCRPDWHIISRWAAALGRWRTESPRTSRRSTASPMGTGVRRCARGRPRSWICSPDVVPPTTDRHRGAVFRFQNTKSDRRHHYHHLRPFARFQPARVPFRSASSLPVAPFPSAARPCPCPCPCPWSCALRNLDFSMDISAYVRVTTRHEGKNSRKTDPDDSSWKFQDETLSFCMRRSFR